MRLVPILEICRIYGGKYGDPVMYIGTPEKLDVVITELSLKRIKNESFARFGEPVLHYSIRINNKHIIYFTRDTCEKDANDCYKYLLIKGSLT